MVGVEGVACALQNHSGTNKQNPQSARRNNFPGEQPPQWLLPLLENLSASNYPGAANMKEHATAEWPAQSSESHDGRHRKERPLPALAPSWKATVAMP